MSGLHWLSRVRRSEGRTPTTPRAIHSRPLNVTGCLLRGSTSSSGSLRCVCPVPVVFVSLLGSVCASRPSPLSSSLTADVRSPTQGRSSRSRSRATAAPARAPRDARRTKRARPVGHDRTGRRDPVARRAAQPRAQPWRACSAARARCAPRSAATSALPHLPPPAPPRRPPRSRSARPARALSRPASRRPRAGARTPTRRRCALACADYHGRRRACCWPPLRLTDTGRSLNSPTLV
jgi:hypothetical protein